MQKLKNHELKLLNSNRFSQENHPYSSYGFSRDFFRFDNGYGASIVRHEFSYGGSDGLYELAVIKFCEKGDSDWGITYETKITDDVIGYLTGITAQKILEDIKSLDKDGN